MQIPTFAPIERTLLQVAGARPDHLLVVPEGMPQRDRMALRKALLARALAEETPVRSDDHAWRRQPSGDRLGLQATVIGLAAAGVSSKAPIAVEGADCNASDLHAAILHAARGMTLRAGGRQVRIRMSRDGVTSQIESIPGTRPAPPPPPAPSLAPDGGSFADHDRTGSTATGSPPAQNPTRSPDVILQPLQPPRPGTKRERIIGLLRRPEGASLEALVTATGWLPHTARAALTGLRQHGYVLERDKDAQGRSIYRIPLILSPNSPSPTMSSPFSAEPEPTSPPAVTPAAAAQPVTSASPPMKTSTGPSAANRPKAAARAKARAASAKTLATSADGPTTTEAPATAAGAPARRNRAKVAQRRREASRPDAADAAQAPGEAEDSTSLPAALPPQGSKPRSPRRGRQSREA